MAKCVNCGSEVVGAFCQICGTPAQKAPEKKHNQFMGQPNQSAQFGAQQQNQFREPPQFNQMNQFGGPQQFSQPNQFGGPQQFNQPNQFGGPRQSGRSNGLGIAGSVLIIINVLIVVFASIPAFIFIKSEDLMNLPANPIYAIILAGIHFILAAVAVFMLLLKRMPAISIIMLASQAVLGIFDIAAFGLIYNDAGNAFNNISSFCAAYAGTGAYFLASLAGCLFWIAGFIISIVATATNKRR